MIPFGLFYALTAFHRFVNDVLHSLLDNCVVVFLASSCSPVLNRHADYAREVLNHLQQWWLHVKPQRFALFQQHRVEFLGYLVDPSFWHVDLRSVEATLSWQAPVKGQTPPSFFLTKNMECWQWR